MNLSTEEREQVATELKRFASDLNLTDDQNEKLRVALTEAREKIAEYMQQNPNTTKADVIRKVVANRDEIRQRVVNFLSPEQLKKWDDEKEKAEDFLAHLPGQSPATAGVHRLLHRAHPPFPGALRLSGSGR
jgi:periplasmic protein CpxP/Spy